MRSARSADGYTSDNESSGDDGSPVPICRTAAATAAGAIGSGNTGADNNNSAPPAPPAHWLPAAAAAVPTNTSSAHGPLQQAPPPQRVPPPQQVSQQQVLPQQEVQQHLPALLVSTGACSARTTTQHVEGLRPSLHTQTSLRSSFQLLTGKVLDLHVSLSCSHCLQAALLSPHGMQLPAGLPGITPANGTVGSTGCWASPYISGPAAGLLGVLQATLTEEQARQHPVLAELLKSPALKVWPGQVAGPPTHLLRLRQACYCPHCTAQLSSPPHRQFPCSLPCRLC